MRFRRQEFACVTALNSVDRHSLNAWILTFFLSMQNVIPPRFPFMGTDRLTRRRPGNDQLEAQAGKSAISRLQRLTGAASVDYGEPSSNHDQPFDEMSGTGASKRSSAEPAGA